MSRFDVLDELITTLNPENVPLEYIVMAKISTINGEERIVKAEELHHMLKDPRRHNLAEARVIYNIKKMRRAVLEEIDMIYDEVNQMVIAKSQ